MILMSFLRPRTCPSRAGQPFAWGSCWNRCRRLVVRRTRSTSPRVKDQPKPV